MRNHGIALGLAIIALAHATQPASAAALTRGTVELTPSLSFSHQSFSFNGSDAGSLSTLAASGILGYCTSDKLEVLGGLLVSHQSVSNPGFGSASATAIGLTGGAQLNFASSGNTIPFVRGALGFLVNSGDAAAGTETTLIAPILEAGLRVLVGSKASVNMGVGYQHQSNAGGVNNLSSNIIVLDLGVSIFPRVGR
jgi:hypothetical protein